MTKPIIQHRLRDEAWLYDKDAEVAVPFELTLCGGEALAEYYPAAKPRVTGFLQKFRGGGAQLMSSDAIEWVTRHFGEFLEEHGFILSPDSEDHYIDYALPPLERELPDNIIRLRGSEGFTDLTETDIVGLCEAGYIIYAAVVGNNMVAVANTGEPITDGTPREVEIGVDTAEKYRKRGYGTACVTALILELHRLGHTAHYECASNNTASIALAEGLGGRIAGKKIYIVGFKDE